MAWLTGYLYRKAIVIAHTADGAQTNYQLKLLVGESSGASGEDIDCGAKCLTTFNDLRFTNLAGTNLDYWIESITGATPNQLATVWIEVDSIAAHPNDTTIYMYYGNAGASAGSNGANTFIQYHGSATADYRDAVATPTSTSLRYRSSITPSSDPHNYTWGLFGAVGAGNDIDIVSNTATDLRYLYSEKATVGESITEAPHLVDGTTYLTDILFRTGVSVKGYIDNNEISTGITTVAHMPTVSLGLTLFVTTGTVTQNWSFVGKYTTNEPTWSSFGAEESYYLNKQQHYIHLLAH